MNVRRRLGARGGKEAGGDRSGPSGAEDLKRAFPETPPREGFVEELVEQYERVVAEDKSRSRWLWNGLLVVGLDLVLTIAVRFGRVPMAPAPTWLVLTAVLVIAIAVVLRKERAGHHH